MAAAIAATRASGETEIEGAECVSTPPASSTYSGGLKLLNAVIIGEIYEHSAPVKVINDMIITIDVSSGSGKALFKIGRSKTGLTYLDTGAMYRAVALRVKRGFHRYQ
jgi:hypothetical protein